MGRARSTRRAVESALHPPARSWGSQDRGRPACWTASALGTGVPETRSHLLGLLCVRRGLIQNREKVLRVVAMRERRAREETLGDTPVAKSFDGELGVRHGALQQGEVSAQNTKFPLGHPHAAAELFCFSKS